MSYNVRMVDDSSPTPVTKQLGDWQKAINDFLEYIEIEKNLSKFTIRNYRHYLTRLVNWLARNHPKLKLEELNRQIVRKYRVFLSRKDLAKATQSYHIIALRSFLKWMVKEDREILAPEKLEVPKAESRSLKFLNVEEVKKLLSQPEIKEEIGLRDKVILEMLFSTGLRVSELVGLNRDEIDLERGEFSVSGKGQKRRLVFLSERALEWLRTYLNKRKDNWIPLFIHYGGVKVDMVTSEGEKMRLTARSVQRLVDKYRRLAGIAIPITPHGLRHSFATDLLRSGANLREVQELLGHKNVSTTQIYTHVTNPRLREVHKKYHGLK